ncbi:MAG: DUF1439 domain-containing protein [Pseudoxanthomonas sp.]
MRLSRTLAARVLTCALSGGACWLLTTPDARAQEAVERDEISIPGERVQGYLATVFPRDFELLGGLLVVNTRDPRLQIPTDGDRVQMSLHASVGAPGYATPQPLGRVEMTSRLRYDEAAQALFLDQPRLERFTPDQAGQQLDAQTREALNLWLQDYARNQPVYALDPQLLAQFGSVKVRAVRVAKGAIIIQFNQPVGLPDLDDAS